MINSTEQLITQLKRHEGFSSSMYLCPAGKRTIGYGRNLDAQPLTAKELKLLGVGTQEEVESYGISREDAELLLLLEVQRLCSDLGKHLPWFALLDDVRKAVLINMAFNLGLEGLLKFKNTLVLIKDGAYVRAAEAMLNSKWASQVKTRALELARQMQSGQWQ